MIKKEERRKEGAMLSLSTFVPRFAFLSAKISRLRNQDKNRGAKVMTRF